MFKYTSFVSCDPSITFDDLEQQINHLHYMTVLLDNLSAECIPANFPEANTLVFAVTDISKRAAALVQSYDAARANWLRERVKT